jgi:hypothetical protein
MRGERVPDGGSVLQQLGQARIELGDGVRGVHTQVPGRFVRAQADAVPDLALQVLGLAEQRGVAVGGDDQPGIRLGKAAQVIEVAVVSEEELAVAVARPLGRVGITAMLPAPSWAATRARRAA